MSGGNEPISWGEDESQPREMTTRKMEKIVKTRTSFRAWKLMEQNFCGHDLLFKLVTFP